MLENNRKNLAVEENSADGLWWTESFYYSAYDHIAKENIRKFPVFIPSIYNSANHFGHTLAKQMTEDLNWPVYIVTRKSQQNIYEEMSAYSPYLHIVVAEDDEICNAGLARNFIQKYAYDNGFDFIFMFDDDLKEFNHLTRGATKHDYLYSKISDFKNQIRELAVWELSTLYLNKKYGVTGTFPNYHPISWPFEYCTLKQSMITFSDYCSQAVCTNIKETYEKEIFYYSNEVVGHEDVDYYCQGLDKGLIYSQLKFFTFSAEPMDMGNFDIGARLAERFYDQMTFFINGPMNWLSRPWLHNRPVRDGSIVPCYNLKKIRKYHNMDANFEVNYDEIFSLDYSALESTPTSFEALGFQTLNEALKSEPASFNNFLLDGKDASGNYLLKWIDSGDVLGSGFLFKLQTLWKNLDISYNDEVNYEKFMSHIEEYYMSSFLSREAGTKEELGIESQEEWNALKEKALFTYSNPEGKEAIIFVP